MMKNTSHADAREGWEMKHFDTFSKALKGRSIFFNEDSGKGKEKKKRKRSDVQQVQVKGKIIVSEWKRFWVLFLLCARKAKNHIKQSFMYVHHTCLHFVKSVHCKPFSRGNWNLTTCYMTMWYSGHSFEVNIGQRSTSANFLKFSIFIWLTWNLNRIFISANWLNTTTNCFWGQHRPNGNIGQFSKTLNFHPID